MAPDGTGPPRDEGDPAPPDKSDLLAAFDGVVNRERELAVERRSQPVRRSTHRAVVVLCVMSWGALAYIWIAKPAALFAPNPAASQTPADLERRLRFGMYLERERVLDYWAANHRLPASLVEAGDVEPGIEYARTGDSTFVVSAMVRDSLLTLHESESAGPLLKPTGIKPGVPR